MRYLFSTLILCCFCAVASAQVPCGGTWNFSADAQRCINTPLGITISDPSAASTFLIRWTGTSGYDTVTNTSNSFSAGNHSYGSAGSYSITVVRTGTHNGQPCRDSITKPVTIYTFPSASFSFSPNAACANTSVSFTNTSGSGLSSSWDFGDGSSSGQTNPSHKFDPTGNGTANFTVQLTVTNAGNCQDAVNHTVTVKERPDPTLTNLANFMNCGATVANPSFSSDFFNTTTTPGITGFTLDWGDGSDTTFTTAPTSAMNHTYTALGAYNLTYTATNSQGCTHTNSYQVINESTPSVSITTPSNSSGCSPLALTFSTSPSDVSPTTSFVWIFEAQDTVIWSYNDFITRYDSMLGSASISHSFDTTSCGNSVLIGSNNYQNAFGVEIIAINNCYSLSSPASSAIAGPIRICDPPIIDFDTPLDSVCVNDVVEFDNLTPSDCQGPIPELGSCKGNTLFWWDFGDGSPVQMKTDTSSVTHSYANPGTYTVSVWGQNLCGTDTFTRTIIVNEFPVAAFTHSINPSSGCGPIDVTTGNQSTGGHLSYKWLISPGSGWSFTNGTSDTSATPQINFSTAGKYYLSLVASNNCGTDTITDSLVFKTPPVVTLDSIASSCEPYAFTPNASFSDGGGTISGYAWSFPGGSPATDTTASPGAVSYASPGSYTITVDVTNECGTSSATQSFTVFPLPVVDAGAADTVCSATPQFALGGTPAGGSWSGSGVNGSTGMFNPSVAGAGSHWLHYSFTDTSSCTEVDSKLVVVNPMPAVEAGLSDTFCLGDGVQTLTGASPAGGTWSGVGITNATTGTFDPATAGAGSHWITYSYTHAPTSCSGSDSVQLLVAAPPTVDAGQHVLGCINSGTFQASGFSPAGGTWSGNGLISATSGTFDPVVADTGAHYLVYTYTHPTTGCTNADSLLWTVNPAPAASFTLNDPGQCLGGNSFTFTSTSTGSGLSARWFFGDGDSSTASPATHSYSTDGSYTISLIATTASGCRDTAEQTVDVHPMPAPAFTYTTACEGDSTAFTNNTTIAGGAISSYQWTFGDGDSSTSFSPKHLYPTGGSYTVELTATSDSGCVAMVDTTVPVGFYPQAQFTNSRGCLGTATVFQDGSAISSGSISSWKWHFGDGDSSTATSPQHQYQQADTFSVQLIVTSAFGCADTATGTVITDAAPAADFAVNDTVQCEVGNSFVFTNNSTFGSGSVSYAWTFGDGDTSTAANPPAQQYTTAGTYTVQLIATSGQGCADSVTKMVQVIVMPQPAFSVNDTAQCFPGNSFSFSTNTSGSLLWDFGDGQSGTGSSPVHSYATADTFLVKLLAIGGATCSDSDSLQVIVHPAPVAAFSVDDSAQCRSGNSFQFTDGSTIASGSLSWRWFFGNGDSSQAQHPQYSYGNAGSYSTQLIATSAHGCRDTASKPVDVHPMPQVAFSPTDWCDGSPIVFTNSTTIGTGSLSYKWHFGDGDSSSLASPTHLYPDTGSYQVTLVGISAEGCRDTLVQTLTVHPIPDVNAGPNDTVCLNNVNFYMTGFSPAGGYWLGNGVDSNGYFRPAVAGAGEYTLQYVFQNGGTSCGDTATKVVKVLPLPQITVGMNDSLCIDAGVLTLTGQSPTGGYWIGTGVTDSTAGTFDPLQSGAGTFSVGYVYESTLNGCIDTASRLVVVHDKPQAAFTVDTLPCAKATTTFVNNSTGAGTYFWDFGDGTTSQQPNPVHVFGDSTFYQITLIAGTSFGCSDTTSLTVQAIDTPVTSFTLLPDSGCGPLDVDFTNLTSGYYGTFAWNFGDGDSSTAFQPGMHTFQQSLTSDTTYYITLTASNKCGVRVMEDSVRVLPSPVAGFSPNRSTGCSPQPIEFQNISQGLPQTFFWDFGNGNTSTKHTPDTQYFTADSTDSVYHVMLIAYNTCGSDTAWDSLTIHPNTARAFFHTDTTRGCAPLTVNFSNFSSGTFYYEWDFGDGNTTVGKNAQHTFPQPGTYTVELAANNGCSYDTSSISIEVLPAPQPSFTFQRSPECAGAEVQFTNTSSGITGSVWAFGNGDSSTLTSPAYAYPDSGNYTVTLTVLSQTNGCPGSVDHPVEIVPAPVAAITMDTAAGCQPLTVQFGNASQHAKYYEWHFGGGNTSGLIQPQHLFVDTGTHWVSLVAKNDLGCTDSTSAPVFVYGKPQVAFTQSAEVGCGAPDSVTFTNLSTNATSYQWTFGNGDTSTFTSPSTTYSSLGTYSIRLAAANSYSCRDTAYGTFTLHPQPMANFSVDPQEGCEPLPVSFTSHATNATEHRWWFGDGDSSWSVNPQHVYTRPGQYTVSLLVRSGGHCTDSIARQQVLVHPKPVASFDYTENSDPQLHGRIDFFNTSQEASRFLWHFGDGDTTTEPSPSHRYPGNGEYRITLYAATDHGCLDTTQMYLQPSFFRGLFAPNAFTPQAGPAAVREWKPAGVGLQEYNARIYTVWGQLIWQSTELTSEGEPAEGWNGIYRDQLMPQDAYVWKIEAKFKNGTVWEGQPDGNGELKRVGTVTLIR